MNVSRVTLLLWGVGSALHLALIAILWVRNEHGLRCFNAWLTVNLIGALVLFILYWRGFTQLYFGMYWLLAFVDILLQVCVVVELAREALQRDGLWVLGAVPSLTWGAVTSVTASVASLFLRPVSDSPGDLTYARVSLFSTVLVCFLFTSLTRAASKLGYSWSGLSVSISYGLVAWNVTSFATDALHLYWQRATAFAGVEYARAVVFQLILVYWIVVLLKRRNIQQMRSVMNEAIDSYLAYTRPQ